MISAAVDPVIYDHLSVQLFWSLRTAGLKPKFDVDEMNRKCGRKRQVITLEVTRWSEKYRSHAPQHFLA